MGKRLAMKIHCIGDSHTSFFTGYNRIQPEYPEIVPGVVKNIRTYRLGAPLAYTLCETGTKYKSQEKLFTILDSLNPRIDFILLCFGEIDCRAHLIKQAEIQNRAVTEVVDECVKRYVNVIMKIKDLGFQVGVWNAIPTAMGFENEFLEYPYYGNYVDRNRVAFNFNNRLKEYASTCGFQYFGVFDKIIDSHWVTDDRYYFDKIHLNSKILPYILKAMRRSNKNLGISYVSILNVKAIFYQYLLDKKIQLLKKKLSIIPVGMKKTYSLIKNKIRNVFKAETKIPSYETKRAIINSYKDKFDVDLLVETGTFLGDTVEFFKNKFETVYSIELSDELSARAIKRFEADENVKIIQGDSGVVLNKLLDRLNKPAIFWLDGHYSSEFFLGDEYIRTARSDKDTPVENELKAIFRSKLPHIVLIDDARLFVGEKDYPTIDSLKEMVNTLKPGYTVSVNTDIIRIVPKKATKRGENGDGNWKSKQGIINKEFIRHFLPANPVIIDAGAHRGDDSIEFARLIPSAEIHAFEPVPAIFDSLKAAAAEYKQIRCYKVALSNSTGHQEMHVSSGGSDASSSLLAPVDHLKDHPDTFFNEKIVVNTVTLDEWAVEQKIEKIDFLWLDMQGFELNVLKASSQAFQRVSAVHMEVSTKQTYENVPQYSEIRSWMESRGFKVEVEEIPAGWDMGNVLFVKKS
jgi:FkbM family methyltransferase